MKTFEERLKEGRNRRGFYDEDTALDFEITYQPMNNGVYNIYLHSAIVDVRQFTGALEVFARAGENDIVCIHLSTPGGNLDATDTFIQGMRECEARVVVKATGGVHSAGTVILLNADEFILSENFNCLIHNGSCGSGGKFSDYLAHAAANAEYMHRIMSRTYEGFLTPEEITQLLAGRDFWLNGEQFVERWEKRNKLMEAKMQADQTAALEAVEKQVMGMIEEAAAERKPKRKLPHRPKKPKIVQPQPDVA